jgi:hypothetical protein
MLVLYHRLYVAAILLPAAAPDKHLSVYSTAANYSLPLVQRDNRDYVGLLEVLEPLGKVTAKFDGQRWRLRYNNRRRRFLRRQNPRPRAGSRCRICPPASCSKTIAGWSRSLRSPPCCPVFSAARSPCMKIPTAFSSAACATHFTASLAGDNPPKLVFHFTTPVNPSVSTEPGALRMTFSREPLVAPALPTLTFGSKVIPSATYAKATAARPSQSALRFL